MFKRQYFISAEVHFDNGKVVASWRQFSHGSFFPEPAVAVKNIEREIAKKHNVSIDKTVIKSFNRC